MFEFAAGIKAGDESISTLRGNTWVQDDNKIMESGAFVLNRASNYRVSCQNGIILSNKKLQTVEKNQNDLERIEKATEKANKARAQAKKTGVALNLSRTSRSKTKNNNNNNNNNNYNNSSSQFSSLDSKNFLNSASTQLENLNKILSESKNNGNESPNQNTENEKCVAITPMLDMEEKNAEQEQQKQDSLHKKNSENTQTTTQNTEEEKNKFGKK